MKVAVTGKGGVGKTTIAAGLALTIKEDGKEVIAIDCDPDMNLGLSLGFSKLEKLTPICEMKELIAQRTGVDSLDTPQTFFKLNPQVDDIPEKFAAELNGIKLLVMGKVNKAGGGCMCPENTFIKNLISHLILKKDEIVIMDMVAGTEHLGRATAKNVDLFLIAVEPTQLAIATGRHIEELVKGLGVKKIFFLGNKIKEKADKDFLEKELGNQSMGYLRLNKALEENRGRFVFDEASKEDFQNVYEKIKRCING